MKPAGLQISKRIFSAAILFAGIFISIPLEQAHAVNDVQASCVIGSSSSCPAQSPQEIANLYGTTANGTYWLNVNGTATQTYLIMDTSYPDGGHWFLGMKGTNTGGSFWYSSTHWTDQTSTLNPTSLSNDVSTEAKFNSFNYLPITKVLGVFKDRASYNFNSSGTGYYNPNSFGGHTWLESISSQTMYSRFNTNSILYNATGTMTRYELYRESNSSSANLVFAYQSGYAKYGFAYTSGSATYRWGVAFNNETTDASIGSSDAQAGIGLSANSAASVYTYADGSAYAINGGAGLNNGTTATYPSGFQIWGKMAAPSLAAPTSLSKTTVGNGAVTLNIGAATGAVEYAVQYKLSADSWANATTVRVLNPTASPTAALTGLASGTYDFRVWTRGTNNSSNTAVSLTGQVIDSTVPTISSISITSSAGADSIYGAGETITATINWSEAVTVTGSPRIPLVGLTSKYLTYSAGSGTSTTTFTYLVTNGDLDRDGISVAVNSLALNGGTITDSGLNTATLSHSGISASSSLVVDGVAPVKSAQSTSVDGSYITISYDETLSATLASTGTFTVLVNSVQDTVTSISISGTSLRLNLTFSITTSATVTVAYSDPTGSNDANAVQDEAGNDAPSFSATSVTNSSTSTSNTTAIIALNPASSTAIYRASTSIRVSTNTSGRVDFYQGGKIISTCRNVLTSANVATCSWKPSIHAYIDLSARFKPSGSGFMVTNTSSLRIFVVKRSGNR